MALFGKIFKKKKDPRHKRLALELQKIEELCQYSDLIDFEIINPRKDTPPDKYLIHYKVKSIIRIDEEGNPIYGEAHTAKIILPSGYPMASSPTCHMLTPVWHPNIRSKGELRGRICINEQVLGHWQTLDMLIEQIGEMLQYKNYHAIEVQPYPEDAAVAKWVREYAEPKGIVDKSNHIYIDDRPLKKPTETWLKSRNQKSRIKILKVRKNDNLKGDQTNA